MHAAKGWSSGRLSAVDAQGYVQAEAQIATLRCGLGIGWRDPSDGSAGIADAARNAFSAEVRDREAQEENRLLYVAMTRAGEHLVLSYSARRENGRPSEVCKRVADRLADLAVRHNQPALNDFPPVPEALGEEPVLHRALPAAQFDSILTVTALAAFRQCPHRYYLSRYLGFEGTPRTLTTSTLTPPSPRPKTAPASEPPPSASRSMPCLPASRWKTPATKPSAWPTPSVPPNLAAEPNAPNAPPGNLKS